MFWTCQITFPLAILAIFIQMSFVWIWPLLHWHPPLHLHHFEEFILIIFDITLCFSQPNKDKERIMRPYENKIFIVEIFKWGVCESRLQVLGRIIRMNDQTFWINNWHCERQLNFCISQLLIVGRPKALQKSAPLSRQRFWQMH